MIFRKWTRLFLLVPLLLSAIQLTPAQALTTNSVIWCPSTVTTPKSNQNGCSPVFSNMTFLLSHLDTKDPAVAGTFWIGKDYNSAAAGDNNIVIDGAAFTRMWKYPLTLKGGWNGPGKSTLDLNSPSTLDGATFAVLNWRGKVSLKNINVLLRNFSTAGVCGSAAVCVKTTGSIQLDRVYEENGGPNISNGAELDNTASLSSPPGSVLVTNSQFLNNNNKGLSINTKGAITLKAVDASQNASQGVSILNLYDATASPVSVSNGQFNGNASAGLFIQSNGPVTLTRVYAENNTGPGVAVINSFGLGNVLVKGTNTFLGNGNMGLQITTAGSVTAEHLVAFQNGSIGVYIDNTTAPTAKGVSITGGDFTGNVDGLLVQSKGNVSLNQGRAYSNTINAFRLNTDGAITLTCSYAYGNGTGLFVRASDLLGSVPKLTLQGFLNFGNTTPEDIQAISVIRTTCPN